MILLIAIGSRDTSIQSSLSPRTSISTDTATSEGVHQMDILHILSRRDHLIISMEIGICSTFRSITVVRVVLLICFTSVKILERINRFCGATDIPVLDFWWCLPRLSKPGWMPSLASFNICTGWTLQIMIYIKFYFVVFVCVKRHAILDFTSLCGGLHVMKFSPIF